MSLRPEDWPHIKDLFDRARALSPDLRGTFLDEACAGNDGWRGEVEGLLASFDQADAFLETPAAHVFDGLRTIGLLEGRRIGPYELSVRIGAGGVGEVYKALDTRAESNRCHQDPFRPYRGRPSGAPAIPA